MGYFDNELEAAREYDRAVLHFRGPSAQLNLPKEQSLEQPFSEAPQMPGSVEDATALAVKSILSAFNSGILRSTATRKRKIIVNSRHMSDTDLRMSFKLIFEIVRSSGYFNLVIMLRWSFIEGDPLGDFEVSGQPAPKACVSRLSR